MHNNVVLVLAIWILVAGLAFVFRGHRGAGAVALWPLRATLRFVRHAVGGALVTLGNAIRGGNRRRH